jgi:hypothetical protein
MFGRRSHQRFTVANASEGVVQTLRDVIVERIDSEQLVVVSRQAGVAGEILALEMPDAGAPGFEVRVTESRPIVAEGAVRHRLTLQPFHSDGRIQLEALQADSSSAGTMLAVLTYRLPVHILNYSGAGCLLDASVRMEKATIGSLRLVIDGREFIDDIQVARCQAVQGSSSYQIGVEFLWIVPPNRQSLRRGINSGNTYQRL